jgi:hypothetical protein
MLNQGQIVAHGTTPDLLSRYTELDVLLDRDELIERSGLRLVARDGRRARVLLDRTAMPPDTSGALEKMQIISERNLTLEELLVALVKSNSGVRWRPRMGFA